MQATSAVAVQSAWRQRSARDAVDSRRREVGEAAREQRVALEAAMIQQARCNGAVVLQVGSVCVYVCL